MREALSLAGAPADLIRWVAEAADDAEAWDGADKGDWIVWLACCDGAAVDEVLLATTDVLSRLAERLPGERSEAVRDVVHAVRHGSDPEFLERAVKRCTALAGPRESYRTTTSHAEVHSARAAVLIAQAAEALAAAFAGEEAQRNSEALHRAGTLGLPPTMMTRAPASMQLVPQRLEEDAVQQELAYVVAAMAHAMEQAALALADELDDEEARMRAEGSIADDLHAVLSAPQTE